MPGNVLPWQPDRNVWPSLVGPRGPPSPAGLGRGAGLVDEDEVFRLQFGLRLEPGQPPLPDVRPLRLGAARAPFFLKLSP
jgi:hypothetical protein